MDTCRKSDIASVLKTVEAHNAQLTGKVEFSPMTNIVSVVPRDIVHCGICNAILDCVKIDKKNFEFVCPTHGVRWTLTYVGDI